MKPITKKLLWTAFILVVVKLFLVLLIQTPTIFADEYVYAKNAQSFWNEGVFETHGDPDISYPPLYPVLLSITYLFQDMTLVYFFMKFLNVLLTTLVIIPTYLLAKDFVKEKQAYLIALLVSIMPISLIYPAYLMSENIFYPLFLFFVYFTYKTYTTLKLSYLLLTLVTIPLLIFSRIMGLITLLILGALLIYELFKISSKRLSKKTNSLTLATFLSIFIGIIILLTLFHITSFIVQKFAPAYSSIISIAAIFRLFHYKTIIWTFLYLGFLFLATGIIPGLYALQPTPKQLRTENFKKFRVTLWLSILSATGLGIYYSARQPTIKALTLFPELTGRFIGRYVAYVLPLLLILGCIYLFNTKYSQKRLQSTAKILGIFLVFSSQLVFFGMYPFNTTSLSFVGLLYYAYNYLFANTSILITSLFFALFFLIITYVAVLLIKKANKTTILTLLFIFLSATSALSYSMTYYNSNHLWNTSEQVQLGKWINENVKEESTFLVDLDYCTKKDLKRTEEALCTIPTGKFVKSGFWIKHQIRVGNIEEVQADYILTKKTLEYELVRSTPRGINLYLRQEP
tara:strand:+ start:11590 stop:13305 length:1716 start_codon:yes stop_codon:yes gene_type:complete